MDTSKGNSGDLMPFKVYSSGDLLTTVDLDTYIVSQCVIRCTSGTRPSEPSEGWHIYETDTQQLFAFKGGQWVSYVPTVGNERFVIKSADQSSTSTSDINDSHLTISVSANRTYIWEIFCCVSSASNGEHFDIDLSIPTDALVSTSWWYPQDGEEGNLNKWNGNSATSSTFIETSTNGVVVRALGSLIVSNTPGSFTFRWRSITGTSVTVRQHSYLRISEVFADG
jgi:hypothetical protein